MRMATALVEYKKGIILDLGIIAKRSSLLSDAALGLSGCVGTIIRGKVRGTAERPKLSDPAHEGVRLQPERDGRVRCSAWLNEFARLKRFARIGVAG